MVNIFISALMSEIKYWPTPTGSARIVTGDLTLALTVTLVC